MTQRQRRCPKCRSWTIVLNGKSPAGRQKLYCKRCRRHSTLPDRAAAKGRALRADPAILLAGEIKHPELRRQIRRALKPDMSILEAALTCTRILYDFLSSGGKEEVSYDEILPPECLRMLRYYKRFFAYVGTDGYQPAAGQYNEGLLAEFSDLLSDTTLLEGIRAQILYGLGNLWYLSQTLVDMVNYPMNREEMPVPISKE